MAQINKVINPAGRKEMVNAILLVSFFFAFFLIFIGLFIAKADETVGYTIAFIGLGLSILIAPAKLIGGLLWHI